MNEMDVDNRHDHAEAEFPDQYETPEIWSAGRIDAVVKGGVGFFPDPGPGLAPGTTW